MQRLCYTLSLLAVIGLHTAVFAIDSSTPANTESQLVLFENFDHAALPDTLPLKARLPNSLAFESPRARVGITSNPADTYGGTQMRSRWSSW